MWMSGSLPFCRCSFADAPLAVQDGIRELCLRAVREGGHEGGNHFFCGCLIVREDGKCIYQVPHIEKKGECQMFEICHKQFMTLFGLTESRLDRLRKKKRNGKDNGSFELKKKRTTAGKQHCHLHCFNQQQCFAAFDGCFKTHKSEMES